MTVQMKNIHSALDRGVNLKDIMLGPDGPFCDKIALGTVDIKLLDKLKAGMEITKAVLKRIGIFNLDNPVCKACLRCLKN